MSTLRLRHLADINPLTPAFNRLANEEELTFLPMEAVWPGERLDLSWRRTKASVSTGYTRFQNGDVLVPKITPTFEAGRSVLIHGLHRGVGVGSTELHVLRPGPLIDQRFLLYVANTHSFLKQGEAEMYGVAGQQRVPDRFLRDLPVQLPTLEEQRRIADFLDAETNRINDLQWRTARQLALLQEQFHEMMRRWTTVGNDETSPTRIPWMPKMNSNWSLLKVGHQFMTGSGTTPTSTVAEYFDGPYWWINSADLNDGEVTSSEKKITDRALNDFPALKLHNHGSLVIAMYGQGATKGKVGLLANQACVNQACCVLSPTGRISTQYARYWFRAHKESVVALAQGAGQPNLSQELIRSLWIPTPDMTEQQKIVFYLTGAEEQLSRKVQLLRERENLLAERRQALITAAVTGQIDVSTASGRGIEE
ncbi:restriction endonuclease subunit S [Streptomyces sp. NPDC002055]|uniref:restriction endonuclease subunit S n=1 Tax=Streptomyces sp. NPDC002055 TaxID=3154534 RepID=UPI003317889F